jgi:ubiquinone/menaquinone biosynthesis C-methylase UbiE
MPSEMALESESVIVPQEVFERIRDRIAAGFEGINHADREVLARDLLNPEKSIRRAEVLERYAPLRGRKLLEVGAGCGVNLVAWMRKFGVDARGIEPGGAGFEDSLDAARDLLVANGLDRSRIQDAEGESIPFPDESFDIVYSANVLEHTREPARVLEESVRVLRTGGVLHFEIPNFWSYYEGHYLVPQPPILFRGMLPLWVKLVFRRDPTFAGTLRTEINPRWCHRQVRELERKYPVELVTLGQELFLERLARPFKFETPQMEARLGKILRLLQAVNVGNWAGRVIVAARGYYPIYLTVTKVEKRRPA